MTPAQRPGLIGAARAVGISEEQLAIRTGLDAPHLIGTALSLTIQTIRAESVRQGDKGMVPVQAESVQHRFVGTAHPYRGLRVGDTWGWGDFYVNNKARAGRKRPLHTGDCPFCGMAFGPDTVRRTGRLRSDAVNYLVVNNSNPIVEGQILIIPEPSRTSLGYLGHRLDLNAQDVKLTWLLAAQGFGALQYEPPKDTKAAAKLQSPGNPAFQQPWACYINAFPGTGRSVAHLHINCVPASHAPLLTAEVAPWQICRTNSGTTVSRLGVDSFYALAVENSDPAELAKTVDGLHRHMNDWQTPYNLLIYPSGNHGIGGAPRVVIVPRDSEYCEAADQRVAGLEFMTGVLIPGANRLQMMDTILRDRALLQATLKGPAQLNLERSLRNVYGLPAAGSALRACRGDGARPRAGKRSARRPRARRRLKAVAGTNDILAASVRPSAAIDGSPAAQARRSPRAVFGRIDSRWWFATPGSSPETDVHARRVDANVLVRIARASICQSDRRVLAAQKKRNRDMVGLVVGHEGGGYVVDPGPWSAELSAGEKVVVLPHLSCGRCDACRRYLSNLCRYMKHIGFHINGTMADLMAYPYQCVLSVGADFPDDALPLVEPLACVLRALLRVHDPLRRLAEESERGDASYFTIFGAGPMGCLTALAVRRNWARIQIRMIEPDAGRRYVVSARKFADQVLESMPPDEKTSALSFVASSRFDAAVTAIDTTKFGETVVLFSGINTGEQARTSSRIEARHLEGVHRREESEVQQDPFGFKRTLVGSSGYILDDVKRSITELKQHYSAHYRKVQNVEINGLLDRTARYGEPNAREQDFPNSSIEALLSPLAIDDRHVSESLKVLIRTQEPTCRSVE